MEEHFQFQPLVDGEASSTAVNEAYYSGVCAGLSFRSLLTGGSFESALQIPQNLHGFPKTEPLYSIDDAASSVPPPYNFFSESASESLHQHQPRLFSYEQLQKTVAVEPPIQNPRIGTASYGKQPRRRHSKLSDKTRCLEKLLPLNRKMDMATVLEEAHKYIKFLQAQISVLQSMPQESSAAFANYSATAGIGAGDLGRLNRQQLLQVLINSPVAQSQLYSNGCCVYSVEQLGFLKKNAEMDALHHQVMLSSSNSNSNPNSFLL